MSVTAPTDQTTRTPDPAHMVIRASAGAGKTFTLSSRYLKLLSRGAKPHEILATTFTRKAADEILSRVLLRAAAGARDQAGARQLAADLKLPAFDLASARGVLDQLVRSLHTVSISTIDSFFNRIAQSFRFELDLPAEGRIVAASDPEAKQLRAEAIEAMLADDDPHVLIDLLRRLHHDQAQRRVTDAIDQIVEDMYETYRLAPSPAVWSVLAIPPTLTDVQVADALAELDAVIGDGRAWGAQVAKGLSKLRDLAAQRDWAGFVNERIVQSITVGDGTYYRKPIDDAIIAALRPLIAHGRAKIIEQTAQRTRALHELLQRFDGHYTRLRRLHRVQLFSDLPLKIGRDLFAPQSDAAADTLHDVYYRLDARVHHLMLDEFQDTSIEQWNVLLPFAQEICAHGEGDFGERTFFCVGDVKQAIYGWRGGCAELFAQVECDLHLDNRSRATLSKSYRSSGIVLDAVNEVFNALSTAAPLQDHLEVATAWEAGFQTHKPARNLPGYVEFMTSPTPRDDDRDEAFASLDDEAASPDPHLAFVARKVKQLAAEAPGKSIGILARTNATVNRLIYHLRLAKLNVSGEGGNLVTDDPAVGVVISALLMADHPGHSAAAFHVLNSPLAPIVALQSTNREHVADVARAIRRRILANGYARLISDWAKQLAPACDMRSVVRLTQLVELADRYDPAITLRTRDFIAFIEASPIEEPAAASIRVMTIHRAKGLEFDIVVMPELEKLLARSSQQALWTYREEPTQAPAAIFAATNKAVVALIEPYCPQYALAQKQEIARRLQDDLCGLYVGMTRPRHALHLIAEPLRETRSGAPSSRGLTNLCYASILRGLLGSPPDESFEGGQTLYEHGDPAWYAKLKDEAPPPAAHEAPPPLRIALASSSRGLGRSWRRVSPSSLENQGQVNVTDLLAIEESVGRQRGSVIHALFEQVEWIDAFAPDDASLRAIAARAIDSPLSDAWLDEQVQQFRAMLELDAVRDALARPTLHDGETLELWRERSFALHLNKQLLRGAFDRVTIVLRQGVPQRAALLDFKTDQPGPDGGFAAAIERYRPQANAYREALSHLLRLDAKQIEAQLLFVSRGVLARV